MNIVIAPDSYKGCLSSIEVGEAIKAGMLRAIPEAACAVIPMADGGEGTIEALCYYTQAELMHLDVKGSHGQQERVRFAIDWATKQAVVETASVVGIAMVNSDKLIPVQSTTYGLGQVIKHCLDMGIRRFIIGLGGSATNDGGAGLLSALGVKFISSGKVLTDIRAANLPTLDAIDRSGLDTRLPDTELIVATDVRNPLLGEEGATYIFGPQKGADGKTLQELEQGMAHYATLIDQESEYTNRAGAGAAGGLGFALQLLGGQFKPGAEVVAQALEIDRLLGSADWLITGEGKSDEQTLYGKAPQYLATLAQEKGVPSILLSGSLGDGHEHLSSVFTACFSVVHKPVSLEQALENAEIWIESSAFQIGRLIQEASKGNAEI